MRRKALSLFLAIAMVTINFTMPTQANVKEKTKTVAEKQGISKKENKVESESVNLSKKKVVSLVEEAMETEEYVEGELLVVLKPDYSSMQAVFKVEDFPEVTATKVENLTYCNNPDSELISKDFKTVLSIKLKYKTDKEMLEAVDILMNRDDVESVSLNEEVSAEAVQTVPPSDFWYEEQWALEKVDAMGAWSKTTGSAEVKVGIIDTGIEYTHEELAPNMWKNPGEIPGDGIDNDHNGYVDDVYGWDFWSNNSDPMDTYFHGTFCAGIIAADLNHKDVAGIAPNVKLVALKVGDSLFYTSAGIKALNYAANMGIDIVNYSSSLSSKNTGFETALNNYNGIFVTSAGNDGRDIDVTANYPKTSEHNNVIKVANTTSSDVLSGTSNYGTVDVTLAAPGANVLSTTLNNTFTSSSGTSFSSPYVAGVVALIKSRYPNLTREQVMDSLKEGVDKLNSLNGKVATGGRLNANKAMEFARFKSIGWNKRYCMDVYTYEDLKKGLESNYYPAIRLLNDIDLQEEIRLIRSKRVFGSAKLNGNGKRHFIIDTTKSVYLDLGGAKYENGGIENKSSDFHLEGSGAVIQNSNWTYGGAIYNTGGMTVDGVRIENCNATFGGGIYNIGTMTLKNLTFYNNRASFGGAIDSEGKGLALISGGIIKNNRAQNGGGGVLGGNNSEMVLENHTQIIGNTSFTVGGGILTNGSLTISDGVINNNIAKENGGGICGNSASQVNIKDASQIVNNTANNKGGGISSLGTMTFTNTTFDNNKASFGGAIHTWGKSVLTLIEGEIKNNIAEDSGGGIYEDSGSQITVKNKPQISNNTATKRGGGIYTMGQFKTESPDGLLISSNGAEYGGGIYGDTEADILLVGVSPGGPSITISNNSALRIGGGVYLQTGADLYFHNTFLAVNKAGMLGGPMFIGGNYTSGGFVQLVQNSPAEIEYR